MNSVRTEYRRSSWYRPLRLNPWGANLFVLTDNAAHTALRSKLAPGYNAKEVPTLESDIDYIIAKLVGHIKQRCLSSPDGVTIKVDFARISQFFTLDVITKVAYGKEFGYLDRNEDVFSWIKTINDRAPLLAIMSDWPVVGKVLINEYVLAMFGPGKESGKGIGGIMKMAEEIVAERFAPGGEKLDRRDMLGAFIRHGVSQRECEVEVPFQIIAGSDTTAVGVRGLMMYLAGCRRVYLRLQMEIDEGIREGRISSPVRNEEAKRLELLQAVIYEALRMQPPIAALLLKEVPPQGDYINGQFIPGGTRVGQNTIAILRDKPLWGEDSDVFRPERWLMTDAARKKKMIDTVEMIFGYGRWVCLGKPMAFMEMNKATVELLRRFDFELADPKVMIKQKDYGLMIQHGQWMRITQRFSDHVEE
ncbi:putative cytochrome P450 E-class, group I [Triangularia verruculosa]|uniref:Cytochrome P450 E-class, group I n=1 Tax=Triangularia verruculosa TaxID=2587418 RepID=A0AAN6XS33_9PEZI|nr:putative cytochrome P450 E-class, group I [Triangularia verruculosa]